ncbi:MULTISPECIES: succinate dehydrogenase, hydrophobic membrane anchor protein [Pseudomonas]|jgi:succinate dehydrogenase / fumarate reductase membrane anchor subunit|uniref:Succinate dehydrogenase hydrophobic membrane anchor subunit n=1 Tax=Pseudomonas flavocrustae TaxID=2991719 RepID=A0ABT6ICM3_9PSED|nr:MULTISPECIES: succinate dehydrogenase, hydrophobic membrane anchor protein [Pseudomonas]MBB2896758.1 succinate dehydrogenase / fumarate reductase membrane anchor subunit [Pseudomonas sp. AS2.8]MDH4762279.1 succinate dehydrogenase, hydrophobic membrane anchor protein [Pseudomonas sp. CBMAI 2609]MDK8265100.1 succinate dehydrogenase, hydrophobic membrane anchor protein [Pseudomonas oryzihabitans]MDR6177623.1 succinate dehydrogenase / fumarate reductase membrane anchor subunit [Pseudomonas sp. S
MVTNVTNLSRSGLYDWMAQRVSAVVLAVYFLFIIGYLILHPGLTFEQWHGLFSHTLMRIFSLLALVSVCVHAWVGMWTISTDYLTTMAIGKGATAVRFLFQAVCGFAMFAFFVWGVQIFWGV